MLRLLEGLVDTVFADAPAARQRDGRVRVVGGVVLGVSLLGIVFGLCRVVQALLGIPHHHLPRAIASFVRDLDVGTQRATQISNLSGLKGATCNCIPQRCE